jgi:hypothetical protein
MPNELGFVLNQNDSAREAKAGWWIFSGPQMGWLVISVLFFIVLAMLLSHAGLDIVLVLGISSIPFCLVTAFVHFMVNGRAPSYSLDLISLQVFRLKTCLFLNGLITRPPELWTRGTKPLHPDNFK